VNLQDLKALGGLLVDIQGQHAHQSMLDTGNQRALLDAHDELAPLAKTVAERFAAWHTLVEQLENRRSTSAQRQSEIELARFQLAELEALALARVSPSAFEPSAIASLTPIGCLAALLPRSTRWRRTKRLRPTPQ
jgi:DNA repair ATPase RecN